MSDLLLTMMTLATMMTITTMMTISTMMTILNMMTISAMMTISNKMTIVFVRKLEVVHKEAGMDGKAGRGIHPCKEVGGCRISYKGRSPQNVTVISGGCQNKVTSF